MCTSTLHRRICFLFHRCIKTSTDPWEWNFEGLTLTAQLYLPASLVSAWILPLYGVIHSKYFFNVLCATPLTLFLLFFIAVDWTLFVEDTGRNQFSKCLWQHPAPTRVSGLVSLWWGYRCVCVCACVCVCLCVWRHWMVCGYSSTQDVYLISQVLMWPNELANRVLKSQSWISHASKDLLLYPSLSSTQAQRPFRSAAVASD